MKRPSSMTPAIASAICPRRGASGLVVSKSGTAMGPVQRRTIDGRMALPAPDPPLRPMTGGVVMGAASRVTVAVTGALTTIFVARLLGPEGAGGYAIALTVVLVMTAVCSLGIEHGIVYYVASGRWPARDALLAAGR